MSIELLCMAVIGLLFAAAVIFGGYRLFLFLLPIWGFFFGLGLGAQTVQAIFGDEFLATITSWVVGFIVGLIFAVLSYLFYAVAVAVISGSAGYALAVGLMEAIGFSFNFLVWIVGIIAAIVLIVIVFRFNLQKYAIIIITSLGGAAAVVFVFLAMFSGTNVVALMENPVMMAIQNSFWWLLLFAGLAIVGIVFQIRANRRWEIEQYNRWAEYSSP